MPCVKNVPGPMYVYGVNLLDMSYYFTLLNVNVIGRPNNLNSILRSTVNTNFVTEK